MKTVSVESCWSVGFPNTCHPRALILLLLSILSLGFFFFFCILNLSQFGFLPLFCWSQTSRSYQKIYLWKLLYSYLTNSLATCNIVGSKNLFLWNFSGTDLDFFKHAYLLMISFVPHGLLSLSSTQSPDSQFSPR